MALSKKANDNLISFGALAGLSLGYGSSLAGGAAIGNRVHKKKSMLSEEDKAKIDRLPQLRQGTSDIKRFDSLSDAITSRVRSGEFDNMSLSEANSKLLNELELDDTYINEQVGDWFDNISPGRLHKKASALKDLGIGVAAGAATSALFAPIGVYQGYKGDANHHKLKAENYKKDLDEYTQLKRLKKAPSPAASMGEFVKNTKEEDRFYSLMDAQSAFGGIKTKIVDAKFDDHGWVSDIGEIDDSLRSMGYDVDNMNFGEYKKIVDDVYNNHIWKGDKWNETGPTEEYMAKYKKASNHVAQIEKLAAQAWKKNFHNLSEKSINRLKDSGVFNSDKELKGLWKGTNRILGKYDAKHMKNVDKATSALGQSIKDTVGPEQYTKLAPTIKNQIKNMGAFGAPDSAPKALGRKGLIHAPRRSDTKLKNIFDQHGIDSGLSPVTRKERDSRKWVDAIIARHEADEVRHGSRVLKNKSNTAEPHGQRIVLTQHFSHLTPKVLGSESANVALAPESAKKYMKGVRSIDQGIGTEIDSLKELSGINYGSSPVYNRKGINKAEKTQRGITTKHYKDMGII